MFFFRNMINYKQTDKSSFAEHLSVSLNSKNTNFQLNFRVSTKYKEHFTICPDMLSIARIKCYERIKDNKTSSQNHCSLL